MQNHRAILSKEDVHALNRSRPALFRKIRKIIFGAWVFLGIWILGFGISSAATVWGTLLDLHLNALNTPLTWYPTNAVLVTSAGGGGLSAGPAFTSYPTNGFFTNVVDAGPYTICLQLNNWRKCFTLNVPGGTGTYNITNLLSNKILADGLGGAILADP